MALSPAAPSRLSLSLSSSHPSWPEGLPCSTGQIEPRQRTPYADWYLSQPSQTWAKPAEHAYLLAVAALRKELSPEEFLAVHPENSTSMLDVQVAVQKALRDYENRTKASRARQWLTKCSSRVKYYEAVFDTLAQHYPEFTSLAWGTFKFLFTAVLNHDELLAEIAKAVARIGDLLPRTELHSDLYPTERMREAVSLVYAKIIEFALMAVRWFKKGKFKHSVTAIMHPYKLSFGPVVEEIAELSRHVDQLASAASKAEIRDQHTKIHNLERRMSQLVEMMCVNQARQTDILADLRGQKQFFRVSQLEDIHHLLLQQGMLDSEASLAYCRSMRKRRVQKLATQIPPRSVIRLQAWLQNRTTSSLLLAESRGVRTSPLDFAVEFVDAVIAHKYPIVWALPFAGDDDEGGHGRGPSVVAVLRSLLLQLLRLSEAAMTEGRNPITKRHLQSATTIEKCFALLEQCISTIHDLLIVVDIAAIEASVRGDTGDAHKVDDQDNGGDSVSSCQIQDEEPFRVSDFVERISTIVDQRRHGCLKVVIASVNFHETTSLYPNEIFGNLFITTDRGRQIGRLMRQPKYRGIFKTRGRRIEEELRSAVGTLEGTASATGP